MMEGAGDVRRGLLTNTVYSSIGLYTEYGAALVVSIVAARHLGPETYGVYTLVMWIASVGVILSNNGITTGVMKFLGEARGKQLPQLAGSLLSYFERLQLISSIGVAAALALLVLLFPGRLLPEPSGQRLLWILPPAVVFRSFYVYYFSAAKGFENFRAAARVNTGVAPVNVLAALAIGAWGGGVDHFVYAYALICLLTAAAMRATLFRTSRVAEVSEPGDALAGRIRRHLVYASAIVFLEVLVLRQTEIFFLGHFSTRENIAFYGMGRSLSASAMLLIPGVVTALLLPMMSRTFGENPALLGPRFLAATRYILLVTVPVVAICEVFADDVIRVLYGADYQTGALVFRVAIASSVVGVVSASASSYQLGADRQPSIVRIMAAAAAVTLALDYFLIRYFELNGAIAAGAIGSLLLGAGLLRHAAAALRVRFEFGTYSKIVAAGAIASLPALGLRAVLPFWIALPLGVLGLSAVYFALTVLLGGWTAEDLEYMRRAYGRRAGG